MIKKFKYKIKIDGKIFENIEYNQNIELATAKIINTWSWPLYDSNEVVLLSIEEIKKSNIFNN